MKPKFKIILPASLSLIVLHLSSGFSFQSVLDVCYSNIGATSISFWQSHPPHHPHIKYMRTPLLVSTHPPHGSTVTQSPDSFHCFPVSHHVITACLLVAITRVASSSPVGQSSFFLPLVTPPHFPSFFSCLVMLPPSLSLVPVVTFPSVYLYPPSPTRKADPTTRTIDGTTLIILHSSPITPNPPYRYDIEDSVSDFSNTMCPKR